MPFFDPQQIQPFEILPGVRIRAPYGQNIMLSMVEIDDGSVVPMHSHPHEQAGILLEGRMELTIGSEVKIVEPGALYIIPPNTPHRAVAIGGKVRVLDIFSPVREDYVQKTNTFIKAV